MKLCNYVYLKPWTSHYFEPPSHFNSLDYILIDLISFELLCDTFYDKWIFFHFVLFDNFETTCLTAFLF